LGENSTHKEIDLLKLIPNYEELSSLEKFLAGLEHDLITGEEMIQAIIEGCLKVDD